METKTDNQIYQFPFQIFPFPFRFRYS